MKQTRRTKQGGSVATFVVVGLILVVTLIGGVYLVNIRGQQARNNQEIATSETKKPVSTDSSKSNNSTKETDGKEQIAAEDSAQTENVPTVQTESQDLPATGPEIQPIQLLGVYLLAVTLIAYILSSRRLNRSL
jgi:predicted lipid-binding transport protein (Tim44 family)